ncbi:MAG: DUF4445 domain-containing protein [Peptococcaceae bacterium]|nr:DUF4445 domain-containing protein [Peptococcaceae bacterium]
MKKITFVNQNKEIYFAEQETIAQACAKAGFSLNMVCGGKGTCKKCKVTIEENGSRREVLACQEKIKADTKIYLEDSDFSHSASILTATNSLQVALSPAVKKIFLTAEQLLAPPYSSNWEHIQKLVKSKLHPPSLELLQKLSMLNQNKELTGLTLVCWNDVLLDIEENDTTKRSFGLAIDLGSTSIVAYLYDLNSGTKVGTFSALNSQISEGADVITRINTAINQPDGLARLQQKVIATINKLIEEASSSLALSSWEIYTIAICGNSAMQHLFLGLNPGSLGRTPFTNIILDQVTIQAKELDIQINPNGIIHFLPLIGGFVGADTTAVLLSLSEDELKETKLIVDLGTNGELLLGNEQGFYATSTAAGPALEGATIEFGMRGTNGAIEKVKLSGGTVETQVIGSEKARGICGSGIIDAVAEMLKIGVINKKGRLLTAEEYLEICSTEHKGLAANLGKVNNINVFYLTKEIYISQKDIRSVQLAKSAICTGCLLLMNEYGLEGSQLKEILISGAFGNYIDVDNAKTIGLIPNFENVPVRSIGNAAGTGTINFLLSAPLRANTSEILQKVTHVNLAAHPDFQKIYFENINF